MLAALAAAPLFLGWVNQCRAWLQNRSAPSLLQPYRGIHKLFHKDAVIAENARRLFRIAPYIVFGAMVVRRRGHPVDRARGCRSPRPPTRSRWSDCSQPPACSCRSPRWTSDGVRNARRPARNDGRLSRRAGAADGDLRRVADCATTALPVISERLATQAFALISEPRVHGGRIYDGAAGRKRADPRRQSGDASRAHDDPRGACCSSTPPATWR